jgi:hypothetical protein
MAETAGVVIGNHPPKYTARNPAIRWLTARWVANLDHLLTRIAAKDGGGVRALEVGCGEGVIAARLHRRFGEVVAAEALEHLPDPDRGLAELARAGRRHLLLSVPQEPIFRGCNPAGRPLPARPRQHPRPPQPLDPPRLHPPGRRRRRGPRGHQPLPLDHHLGQPAGLSGDSAAPKQQAPGSTHGGLKAELSHVHVRHAGGTALLTQLPAPPSDPGGRLAELRA